MRCEQLAFRLAVRFVGLRDLKMISPAGELQPFVPEGFRFLAQDFEGEIGPLACAKRDGSSHGFAPVLEVGDSDIGIEFSLKGNAFASVNEIQKMR
mgnify:CR=1 FL=1